MTFDSSNREKNESATAESIELLIRTAMKEGCIRPCHVFDLVDEVLDRLNKQRQLLSRVHDYLGDLIRNNLVEDTPRASDLADDVWDAIHIGDQKWKNVHKNDKKKDSK